MNEAAHILLVGNDGRLLNERAALLEHFWSIAAVSTFDDAASSLHWADMLVLCHTVNEEQRSTWVASSRAGMPTRAILSLEAIHPVVPAGLPLRSGTDAMVDHAKGPAALVSTIYELLNERGLASKPWVAGRQTLLGADGRPEPLR